ncbi:MAG: Rrf2 family transcriptional regulator [Bacteroidales bacterium]|nr:Rrf2 family transcriptional regulator [Bacteroidales bacterium]
MKVNTLQRYGLRAMLEVALHDQSGLFQKDIAHNQKISNRYLDHIVSRLKTAGLLKNKSGKKSGYILGRDAAEITVLDIMNAFQTDVQVVDCVDSDYECHQKPGCVVGRFWMDLNTCIKDFLSTTTLKMLAKEQEKIYEKFQ